MRRALGDALTLRHLGPAYTDDDQGMRRVWHHCTFYGFLLCFAATSVAAVYHNVMGWVAPYPIFSVPVVLGTVGGLGLLAGPVGLLWLKMRRPLERRDRSQLGFDLALLILLFETSLTGLLLLAFRQSTLMGALLGVHLGAVAGLFLVLPYGKFVHGLYRFCALVRDASERSAK